MQFRGIYPRLLTDLGVFLGETVRRVGGTVRPCLHILDNNDLGGDAAVLADGIGRFSRWAEETAAELQMRAELIRRGQSEQTNVWSTFGARYALTTLVSLRAWATWEEAQRTAETVARDVSRWLEQRWNDWDVTNTDLHNIQDALSGLGELELNLVIATLTASQLQRWIEEMGNRGNGFSRDEKRDVYRLLAGKLSGDQLQRVHDALLETGTVGDLIDFGFAVRVASPDEAIADFVTLFFTSDVADHRYSTVAPVIAVSGIESAAVIRRATRAIVERDGALEIVIVDSLAVQRTEDSGTACTPVDPLASLVQALRSAADVETATEVFTVVAAGVADESDLAQLLDARYNLKPLPALQTPGVPRPEDAHQQLTDTQLHALLDTATNLLMSDVDAVIAEMATTADPFAEVFTGYLRRLIDADRIADVGTIAHGLRDGAEVDPIRFASPGPDPDYPYPYAQGLAYFAGALTNAVAEIADDAATRIKAITTVAGFLSGTITPFFEVPIHVGLATTVGELAGDWAFFDTAGETVDDSLTALNRTVVAAMQPDPTADVSSPGGDLAWQAWLVMFRRITPANKK